METAPKFSFDSVQLEQVIAHEGNSPILTRRVFVGDTKSGVNFVDYSVLPPGSDIGTHTHGDSDEELYIIMSGRGMMYVDREMFEVGHGDCVVNRPGGTHGLVNIGDADLKMIVVEVSRKGE